LEVAAEIIKSGVLKCRNKVGKLICDVANQGALWNNPDAHEWVRLYFRPKNSFHYKTEGVKSKSDPYRADYHMSIPVAFAFDFLKVMTLPNASFVPGNFAKGAATPQTGDASFDRMNFDLIYHDSPLSRDRKAEVHNWRMSEVVVTDELSLSNLSFVICRTTHEERSLRYAIENSNIPRIIVEQKGSIFMKRGMFIDEISWSSGQLLFKFHEPTDSPQTSYSLKVCCWDHDASAWEKTFAVASGRYRLKLPVSEKAIWRIELENCVVYHAPVPSTSGLVVLG
jgi:hypothetical protein